jgi:hypothetical protein
MKFFTLFVVMSSLFSFPSYADIDCQSELLDKIVRNNKLGDGVNRPGSDIDKTESPDGKILSFKLKASADPVSLDIYSDGSQRPTDILKRKSVKVEGTYITLKKAEILDIGPCISKDGNTYDPKAMGRLDVNYNSDCRPVKAEFCQKIGIKVNCIKADRFGCIEKTDVMRFATQPPKNGPSIIQPKDDQKLLDPKSNICNLKKSLCSMFKDFEDAEGNSKLKFPKMPGSQQFKGKSE